MAATEDTVRVNLSLDKTEEHPANIIFTRSPKEDMTDKEIMDYYVNLLLQKEVGTYLLRESRVKGCLSLSIHRVIEKEGKQVSQISHCRYYFANGKWNTHSPDTPLPEYTPLNLKTIGRRARQLLTLLENLGFSPDKMLLATAQQASKSTIYVRYTSFLAAPATIKIINSPAEGMTRILNAVHELLKNPQQNTAFKEVIRQCQNRTDDEGMVELFEEWLSRTPAEDQITLLELVQCPISLSIMTEPYVLSTGHVVNSDIAPMLKSCPMTKEPIDQNKGHLLPEIKHYTSMLDKALRGFKEAVINSLSHTQQSTAASSLVFFALSPNQVIGEASLADDEAATTKQP